MGLRAEKKSKLRGKILANAIQLFKERGFDEVTIEDIVGQLEISQATFFNYFPSKDAILQQAAEDTVSRTGGCWSTRCTGTLRRRRRWLACSRPWGEESKRTGGSTVRCSPAAS